MDPRDSKPTMPSSSVRSEGGDSLSLGKGGEERGCLQTSSFVLARKSWKGRSS